MLAHILVQRLLVVHNEVHRVVDSFHGVLAGLGQPIRRPGSEL
jgi:hypothetical protein